MTSNSVDKATLAILEKWKEFSDTKVEAPPEEFARAFATVALDSVNLVEVKKEALREARMVITQYLASAEQWRYDRVKWAFAIMLGEIPEDTPEPEHDRII